MRKEQEQALKPGQAALIVTYGNTTRKTCPLDRDLIVLGRTPACDFALISPEVAPVHCLIQRNRDGWGIRDCCGGRHAARLNGRPIHEEKLHDGDVLQIGTFSFEARLPASRHTPTLGTTPVPDERLSVLLQRLQRSRRKLVHLALRWRRSARESQPLPPSLAELERQAECLRGLQRDYQTLIADYERRLNEVEKAEREVCDQREALARECTERQLRLDKAERELTRRLDLRSRELDGFARYLHRRRELLEQPPTKAEPATPNGEGKHWQERCEQLQAAWTILEASFQQQQLDLKAECDRLRGETETLASTVRELQNQLEQPSAQVHREHSGSRERMASVRQRMSHLLRLRQQLAGSAPSAPGEQLRPHAERITEDRERPSADRERSSAD